MGSRGLAAFEAATAQLYVKAEKDRQMATENQARAARDRARLRLLFPLVSEAYGFLVPTANHEARAAQLAGEARSIADRAENLSAQEVGQLVASTIENPRRTVETLNTAIAQLNFKDEQLGRISGEIASTNELSLWDRVVTSDAAGVVMQAGAVFAGATGIGRAGIEDAQKSAAGKDAIAVDKSLKTGEKLRLTFGVGVGIAAALLLIGYIKFKGA